MDKSKVVFIIPVYNEGSVIKGVLEEIFETYEHVVCVNDGSSDDSGAEILKTKAYLVNHPINMGQGAALQTGVEFARQIQNVEYFVTYDADGQHRLDDVGVMIRTIQKDKVDIVLGSRFLGSAVNMPKMKRRILKLAISFSNATSGIKLTDTHNGLRVFTKKVADDLQITMPDMSHASEILEIMAKKHLSYTEVPVTIQYTEYSMKKGQTIMNAINIAFDTLLRKISR
jgi:glycosyltransferase involved in cell wall biosynthesis